MSEFIIKYWLEVLFAAITGALGAYFKGVQKKQKEKQKELEEKQKKTDAEFLALKQAMTAMLHDRLFELCNHYISIGYTPIEKAEQILDNAKIIYDAYHALGGNGTGNDIYKAFKALPLKKGDDQGHDWHYF